MKRPSLFSLGLTLIRLHLKGWRPIPGYTVTERECDGTLYVAVWIERP